jgi:hypothetical protein
MFSLEAEGAPREVALISTGSHCSQGGFSERFLLCPLLASGNLHSISQFCSSKTIFQERPQPELEDIQESGTLRTYPPQVS